ncbi:DUF481 domain-containing protein [Pontiella sp.]|uniref:DUF481 domain-containing protein n=1 Tax=Pontiella sp. TaxID=2837462 RepID=UPI00356805EA
MKNMLRILVSLMAAATTGLAQDTVVLKNGDVLSGKILQQDAQHVFLRSSAFGSVSLSTRDIAKIQIRTEELGEIQVPADALEESSVEAEDHASPEPENDASPDGEAPPSRNPEAKSFARNEPPGPPDEDTSREKKRWSGEAALSFAMRQSTTSNQSGVIKEEEFETYLLNGKLKWKGDRNNVDWNCTYRYSESDLKKYDDFLNLTQQYKHSFENDNYFASAKTVYQRDYRRQIEDEYLQTAEFGIKWVSHAQFQLTTSAGGGYHMYDRLIDDDTETLSIEEPKFIFDESLRWQLINTLTFIQKYTHLGDLENYHSVFSAGLENKLVKDLFLQIEYRLDRDTEVYYDDKGYYDRAVLTKLLYKF